MAASSFDDHSEPLSDMSEEALENMLQDILKEASQVPPETLSDLPSDMSDPEVEEPPLKEESDSTSDTLSDMSESAQSVCQKVSLTQVPTSPQGLEPEQLQEFIDGYRDQAGNDTSFPRAMGLVMSLGVTVAAVIYAGYYFGNKLVVTTGLAWLLPVCLMLGVAGGFWIGFILIKPFLREPIKSAKLPKYKPRMNVK